MSEYTWVPVFGIITEFIKDYENHQPELIEILNKVGIDTKLPLDDGFNGNRLKGLSDRDKNDEIIPLSEIDPFSFFSFFMKFGIEKRLLFVSNFLKEIKPDDNYSFSDFDGVPSAQALRVWLFPYLKDRDPESIKVLWKLFFQAIENKVESRSFSQALTIAGTALAKLTQCLFYVNPKEYFPIDQQTKPWLEKNNYTSGVVG